MTANWRSLAACRPHATDVFFPRGDGNTNPIDAHDAKAICARCPVIDECLDAALALEGNTGFEKRAGIWGGCTPKERVALTRKRTAAAA